jgi:hypothetical protein
MSDGFRLDGFADEAGAAPGSFKTKQLQCDAFHPPGDPGLREHDGEVWNGCGDE